MTKRISKAIDIFLDAINNGVLMKGSCTACAVGNLVAHGYNYEIPYHGVHDFDTPNAAWAKLFCTSEDGDQAIRLRHLNDRDVQENIEATDFTWEELAKIEKAFETNTDICFTDYHKHTKEEIRKDQIRGLEAVVQVMLDFDDCEEQVQEVFTSRLEVVEK